MKIAFMVATRGNPRRALAVIECAKALASGRHTIEFSVGIDGDDVQSNYFFRRNMPALPLSIGNRPPGVGAVWNRLVAAAPGADVYCPFPDDCFIGTPDWDETIAMVLEHGFPDRRLGVIAWNDLANPGQCTLPIVTREWLELTGPLYDERFPFWFYDTCVDELVSFIAGRPAPVIPTLVLAAKKGLTQRMRELDFWWDLYVATRYDRLHLASRIRRELGIELPPGHLVRVLMGWRARDIEGRRALPDVEAALAAHRDQRPSAEYITARAAAEAYMATARFQPLEAAVAELVA